MIERVLLIRHGQTDWNVAGRWQGFEQTSLNEEGLQQAHTLANYLRDHSINAIFSSDLPRAFQTASILAAAFGLTPQPDPRLRELNLGAFQGLTYEQIQVTYPHVIDAWRADWMGYPVPNGESRLQMQNRAYQAWESIVRQPWGPEVAVVSHGGTIKLLLMKLFEQDSATIRHVELPNTSISTVERAGEIWRVASLGRTPHLVNGHAPLDGESHG
jgi:broad specificity phosphatase PhoE